jgi:hypothetical protein
MKKSHLLSLLIFSALLAGNSFANTEKMTYEKAMESDKKTFHNNSVPLQETIDNWNKYVKAPNESSGAGSGIIEEFTMDNGEGRAGKRLKLISTHICTLGQVAGEYFRGLKAVDVRVERNTSDGYWYLFADGYESHNYGKAICWTK